MTFNEVEHELVRLSHHEYWKHLEAKANALAKDICHDRGECEVLEIPYTKLTGRHYRKAKLAAWYYLITQEEYEDDM